MTVREAPPELRSRIAGDLRPVKPLRSPWKRVLAMAPVALVAMGMPLVYFSLRDTGELGLVLGWIPIAMQILLAFAILFVALREAVPGFHASATGIFVLCLAAYGLQVLVNLAIFIRNPPDGLAMSLSAWVGCFRMETLIGVPILLVIAWLVARALPQRPVVAGFLAGTGAGLAGDASWRLICPASEPTHVLLGHTGGIMVLSMTGLLLGWLWSRLARQGSR